MPLCVPLISHTPLEPAFPGALDGVAGELVRVAGCVVGERDKPRAGVADDVGFDHLQVALRIVVVALELARSANERVKIGAQLVVDALACGTPRVGEAVETGAGKGAGVGGNPALCLGPIHPPSTRDAPGWRTAGVRLRSAR